jgi:uracil-DNA glycosylase family 4
LSDGARAEEGSEVAEAVAELRRHLAWLKDAGVREVPDAPPAPAPAREPPRAAAAPAVPPVSRVQGGSEATPARAAGGPPPGAPRYGPADKGCGSDGLLAVRGELGECSRCKLGATRTTLVFGVGSPGAELVFVGEGPGEDEDRQGEPFVGRAGQLLTKMIEAMGYRRDEVYIANVVKCRPPGNRNPEPDEIEACEPFLRAQLEAIGPKVVVALGKFAAQTLLRDTSPISRLRGRWFRYGGVRLMPTFHPAYLLRSPHEKARAWEDLQLVMKELGKPAGKARS